MAFRKVNDDSLATVAAAIRAKGGTSELLAFPDGFVSAIGDIQAGGGSSSTMVITSTRAYFPTVQKAYASNVLDVPIITSAIGGIKE